ncbi:MAG: hypothetical protein WCO23_01295 [bacterium]
MNDVIYLEPDVEITRVIEKIKATKSEGVVLALPRGSTLAHSVVNLKLLKRTAESIGRFIIIAANDKVAHNLASQVGLPFYSKVAEAENANHKIVPKAEVRSMQSSMIDEDIDPTLVSSIKVKTYNRFGNDEAEESVTDDSVLMNQEDELIDENFDNDEIEDEDNLDIDENSPKFSQRKITVEDEEISSLDQAAADYSYNKKIDREMEERLATNYDNDEIVISAKDKKSEKANEPKMPTPPIAVLKGRKKSSKLPLIISLCAIFALLVLAAAYYVFVPYMKASIVVKTDNLEKNIEITVDRNVKTVDLQNLIIPGQQIENTKEATQKFTATGQKDAGEKAIGLVDIYNMTSDDLGLAAGAKISTKTGLVYTLQAAVKVPKASIYTTTDKCTKTEGGFLDCTIAGLVSGQKVTASNTGEKYNLAGSSDLMTLGGFSSSKLYAKSAAGFAGGTTKTVTIVTADDLAKADSTLKESLMPVSSKELTDTALAGNIELIEQNVGQEVVSSSATKKVDEEASEFEYSMKVRSFATGFSVSDMRLTTLANINSSLDMDKMLIAPDSSEVKFVVSENNSVNGTAKLAIDFIGKIGLKMNENAIKSAIKNKKMSTVSSILAALPGPVESSKIEIWPKFMPITPLLERRIFVEFKYSED